MSTSALFIPVDVIHRLSFAVRFFDIFTGETVRAPLTVSIPDLRLTAVSSAVDGTFRFLVTNRDLPGGGPFDIEVNISGAEYETREDMQVSLPIVVGHPPPILRSDFLLEFPLWPTRRRRTPPGETAVTGRIVSGGVTDVDGLRIFLFAPPGPAPATPYAYTNAAGEFLFRLPQLRAQMSGATAVTTASLDIEVRDQANAPIAVNPGNIVVDLGRSSFFEFAVP